MNPSEILNFWFKESTPKQHFVKDLKFDQLISYRFSKIHKKACNSELFQWRKNPEAALAEIIILDQFSRNLFRDTPQAFAQDPLALALAQNAIQNGFDKDLPKERLSFLYMPFMHSESLLIHDEAIKLFSSPGLEGGLEFEHKHRVIIEKFGRYPHRNKSLGRTSTLEEIEFLNQPNSSF